MLTDELIKEKLPKKEARELLTLIRRTSNPSHSMMYVPHLPKLGDIFLEWDIKQKNILEREQKVIDHFQFIENYMMGFGENDHMKNVLRCWYLYQEVCDDVQSIMNHWHKSYQEQRSLHKSYSKMTKPPRQDNKTYINRSPNGYSSNRNKIRYPKKKRKTAWKRFYRLFPHLDPNNLENES